MMRKISAAVSICPILLFGGVFYLICAGTWAQSLRQDEQLKSLEQRWLESQMYQSEQVRKAGGQVSTNALAEECFLSQSINPQTQQETIAACKLLEGRPDQTESRKRISMAFARVEECFREVREDLYADWQNELTDERKKGPVSNDALDEECTHDLEAIPRSLSNRQGIEPCRELDARRQPSAATDPTLALLHREYLESQRQMRLRLQQKLEKECSLDRMLARER